MELAFGIIPKVMHYPRSSKHKQVVIDTIIFAPAKKYNCQG